MNVDQTSPSKSTLWNIPHLVIDNILQKKPNQCGALESTIYDLNILDLGVTQWQ